MGRGWGGESPFPYCLRDLLCENVKPFSLERKRNRGKRGPLREEGWVRWGNTKVANRQSYAVETWAGKGGKESRGDFL